MGTLNYSQTLDNEQFKNKLRESSSLIRNSAKTAESEGLKIDTMIKRVGATMGVAFGGAQLINFSKQCAMVRGEFQQLEVAFTTMLGSKGRADALMSKTIDFAAKTPFDLQGVAQGTKQLLAYGSSAEEVTDELRMLGNIAAGLSIPLGDIVYLYGTTRTQGKMYTMDLRQFMGRGIPLAEELAKQFGVTKDKVGELVTAGKVGFPEMNKALQAMTSEGGKFYNLMDEQSKTITGKISNLGDAVQQMFNKIGKSGEGVIAGAIDSAGYLVENYEDVGKVVLDLVAAYGAYKAAVITVHTVEKLRYQYKLASMTAETAGVTVNNLLTSSIKLQTKALLANTKAALTNPYVLLGALVAGLVFATYKLITAKSAEERANEAVNKTLKEYNDKLDEAKSKAEEHARIMQDDTATAYEKRKAYEDLIKQYPELLKKYSEEEIKVMSLIDLTKELNKINGVREGENIEQQYQKAVRAYDSFKTASDAYEINNGLSGNPFVGKLNKAKAELEKWSKERSKFNETTSKAELDNAPVEVRVASLDKNISEIDAQIDILDKKIAEAKEKEAKGGFIPYNESSDFLDSQRSVKESNRNSLQKDKDLLSVGSYNPAYKNKAYWENIKKEATEAIEAMDVSKKGTAEWIKQQKLINQSNAELQKFIVTSKSTDDLKKQREQYLKNKAQYDKELLSQEESAKFDRDQADIDALDDGFVKEQKKRDLNHSKAKAANEARSRDMISNLQKLWDEENELAKKQGKSPVHTTKATSDDLSAGQKEVIGAYSTIADMTLANENKKALQSILTDYQSYADKKEAIEKDYAAKIDALYNHDENNNRTGYKDGANKDVEDLINKEMNAATSAIDVEQFKKEINWEDVFGDLDKQITPALQSTLAKLKKFVADAKASGNDLSDIPGFKDMVNAITEIDNEIDSRNPFAAFSNGLSELSVAREEVKLTSADAKEASEEYKAAAAEMAEANAGVEFGVITKDSDKYKNALSNVANAEIRVTATQNKHVSALNKQLAATINVTSAISSINGVFNKLGSGVANLASVFDDDLGESIGQVTNVIGTVVDSVTSVIDTITEAATASADAISSTVDATSAGVEAAGEAGASSMSTLEKASVILAVITAALQVATAIAGLFNKDKSYQKEIERLQGRIDQLQWELDNANAVKIDERVNALERVRQVYKDTTEEVYALMTAHERSQASFLRYLGVTYKENEILQASAEKLTKTYANLDYTLTHDLGESKYSSAKAQLENLTQQQILISEQIDNERKKKKTDYDKIDEWEQKIKELGDKAVSLIDELVEDIIGGSADGIASKLGDAIIDAFSSGEDAAKAWGGKVNEIVADVMKRMLISKYLEEPLGKIFDEYKSRWFNNGDFDGNGGIQNVIDSMGEFSSDLNEVGSQFKAIWENLPDDYKNYFKQATEDQSATNGGFQTMSEDTGSEINGRFAAIQINTANIANSVEEMRGLSLIGIDHLTNIEKNTRELYEMNERLDKIVKNTANI